MRALFPIMPTLVAAMAHGQSPQWAPAPPPVYGSVSGHITCVDTNQPARLASVTLQNIDVKPEPDPASHEVHAPMMRKYQTSLDGSFFISKVPPGTYYVVIEVPGYLSPIKQFSRTELQKPTVETLARVLKTVPTVTVEASHTSNLDTRIERGAELSGTIRYEERRSAMSASPLWQRKNKGKKTHGSQGTSARRPTMWGTFASRACLPANTCCKVILALNETYVSSVLGNSGSMMMMAGYSVSFYSGDVARKDKAKRIKLEAGEQRDGADITIPVSKMHRVVGTLTTQRSGHVINAGTIVLRFSDGTDLANTKVDPDDNTFHFDFVPEGEYTLAVTDAREVVREAKSPVPRKMPMPNQMKETLVREYGTATQPLVVQSDMTGITIPVPAKATKPSAATQ